MSEKNKRRTLHKPVKERVRHMGPPGSALGRPAEKAKNFKGSIKRLAGYLKPQLPKLIIVLIFAIVSTVFTVKSPKIQGNAINDLTDGFIAKSTVNSVSEMQNKMDPQINKMLKQIDDAKKSAATKAKEQVASQFNRTIDAKKQQAYSQAVTQADAMVTQKFAQTMDTKKQQAYAQAMQQAEIQAKAAVDSAFKAKVPAGITDFSAIPGYNEALTQAKAQADTQAKAAVDAQFAKQQSAINAQLASAKLQAETQAKAAVDAAFAKQQADMQKQLTTVQNQTADKVSQTVEKTILDKAGFTQTQFDNLKKIAALPNVKTISDNNKKADTIQQLFDLSNNMPSKFVDKKTSVSKTDLDKGIADVRKYGGNIPYNVIWNTLVLLLGIYLLSSLFMFLMQYIMSGVAQSTVHIMRHQVDAKLSKLPLRYFDSHPNGDTLSRMTNDIDTISTTLQQSLTQLITSILQLLGYIWMMLTISVKLTLIVLATLPVYILVTMLIAKHSQKFYASQQKYLGELSGHTEEMFTGHIIVKAFGHEEKSIKMFKSFNDDLYHVGWKAQFMSGIMMPLMNFISNIGYVLIAVIGGIFVTKSYIGLGDIVAFISYSKSFSMPIIQTANIANIIQSTVACAERVFELLDEEEELPDDAKAEKIENPKGFIRFDHVDFSYNENEPLIEDMNLDIKPGETVAIVGPTGAGKTTLVNLLMRFYEIRSGEITFDDVSISKLSRGDLRKMFGMVLQDTWLYNGTIRDNIAYGRADATDEEIIKAAKAAHADRFIRSLPDGYNTVLNEEASNISQGQKQLLTIARAILADPAVLILDEATSSVDTRTEVLIQKAMSKLMQGRTNFVIAHRLSTIRDAHMILVMNHGKIIEKGNHKELLAQNGFYADLYNSQFTGASNI